MHNMKNIVVFSVLSALLVIVAGCDNDLSTQTDFTVSNKENSGVLSILSMLISCLALIIAIIVFIHTRQKVNSDDVEKIIEKLLRKQGLLKLKNDIQSFMDKYSKQKASNQVPTDGIVALEQSIKILEGKISNIEHGASTPPPMKTVGHHMGEAPFQKVLYANPNSNEYFTNVVETKQDTCVYVINLESETKGTFDIISIEKIKQRNGWDSVINYDGDCTINEATRYKRNSPGTCEKVSDDKWKVVERLNITILK